MPAEVGSLSIALRTVAASGTEYELSGLFVIRDASGVTVRALSAQQSLGGELTTQLTPGDYTVELQAGWELSAASDGEPREIEATLESSNPRGVTITHGYSSFVGFVFQAQGEVVRFDEQSLVIRVSVNEVAVCGDGAVQAGEACDSGAFNGQSGHCDVTCAFLCEEACPLRVDPAISEPGGGRAWSTALSSVQAGIDVQAALGGGEVWVKGPGPFETLAGSLEASAFSMLPGVDVIGGFVGDETRLSERPLNGMTIIHGVLSTTGDVFLDPQPLIVGASDSTLQGFSLQRHEGSGVQYVQATDFRVVDVALEVFRHYGGLEASAEASTLLVDHATGSMERVLVARNGTLADLGDCAGIEVRDSTLTVRDSILRDDRSANGCTGLLATGSVVHLDGVQFRNLGTDSPGSTGVLTLRDSQVVIANCAFVSNGSSSPALEVFGSQVALFHSYFESNNAEALAPVSFYDSDAWLFNVAFMDGYTGFGSGALGVSGASSVQVTNASFARNRCVRLGEFLCIDLQVVAPANVEVRQSVFDQGEFTIVGPFTGSGNCLTSEAGVDLVPSGDETALLLGAGSPCLDLGDEAVAEQASQTIVAFAESLGFSIDSPFAGYSTLRSSVDECSDGPPLDPGKHYAFETCQ